jgi:hypothetical protein
LPARLGEASPKPDAACLFRERFPSLRLFVDFTWLAYNFLKVVFVAFCVALWRLMVEAISHYTALNNRLMDSQ